MLITQLMGQIEINIMCFLMGYTRDITSLLWCINLYFIFCVPNKNAHPEYLHEVMSDRSNINILSNIMLVLFKNVNIKKDKAQSGNGCHLGDVFTIENINDNWKNLNKIWTWKIIVLMLISWFWSLYRGYVRECSWV